MTDDLRREYAAGSLVAMAEFVRAARRLTLDDMGTDTIAY